MIADDEESRASLRAYVEDPHTVEEVITKLNRVLWRDTRSEQFVSLFYGMLDVQDRTLTYVNAGHNAPILGILQDASYEEEQTQLLAGDLVFFYTDGVTEAERDDECFGEARLLELARANICKSSHEVVEKVLGEVAEFSSNPPQSDDRTVIVLKVLP